MSQTHARSQQVPDGLHGEQRPNRSSNLDSAPGESNSLEDGSRAGEGVEGFAPLSGFSSLSLTPTSPIQPFVLHHARIATILYDAKVRPTHDAVSQFISVLATLYPAANAVAGDLAHHALLARPSYPSPTIATATVPASTPASRSIYLRRINVTSVARFAATASFIMASMRLWLVVSLALARCTASLSQLTDVAYAIKRIVRHAITRRTDVHFYDWIVGVVLHRDPLFAMQRPISFAGLQLNSSLYVSIVFVLPIIEAAVYYVVGALVALSLNVALSLCNGLRVEGQDN